MKQEEIIKGLAKELYERRLFNKYASTNEEIEQAEILAEKAYDYITQSLSTTPPSLQKEGVSDEEIRQMFLNKFNCYASTACNTEFPAMTEETFLIAVRSLLSKQEAEGKEDVDILRSTLLVKEGEKDSDGLALKFDTVVRPVMKWLSENEHPHTKIIIESNSAELVEGKAVVSTDEYLKD